ncbi:MAG TPA: chemotaxis protein CheB [Chloroflexia bacterium]|nr:chemotaxis protein CheB [Chloroflexia bacterium]
MAFELVVVGASLGGLAAVEAVLSGLPATFPLPVAIVQHCRPGDGGTRCAVLQGRSVLPVDEVDDKADIRAGRVYLAPPDYHLLVEPGAFALSTAAPVAYSRPSIDVLFESAAAAYGAAVIGVVLTGANQDGMRGAVQIARQGGVVIVQDPGTAESPTMPAAALRAVPAARVLPLPEIARWLTALSTRGGERGRERPHGG